MSSAAETNRCRLPAEGAADPGPPPRNLPLPRHVAPRPAEPDSLGNIFDFLKVVNAFPYLKRVTATPAAYPRFIKFAAGCPRKVVQTPDHVGGTCPHPGTLPPGRRNRDSLGKFFDFLKLVNDFPAQTNRCRLPGARCCRHRTTTQELVLTPARCPRPAEPNSLGKIFDFLKLVNEFCGGDKSLPAARGRCCRHRTTTQELALTPGPCTPAGGTEFPREIFDFLKLVNDFPAETNRCRLPGEGVADPGPPPRNLSLPRDLAPLAGGTDFPRENFRLFKTG